jgi:hypothetical protein
VDGSTDSRGDTTLFTELSGESRSVDPETAADWKNYRLLQGIKCSDLCDIYNASETIYFSIYNTVKPSLFKGIFAMVV